MMPARRLIICLKTNVDIRNFRAVASRSWSVARNQAHSGRGVADTSNVHSCFANWVLRLLSGPQQDFAGERLWSLRDNHRHSVSNVRWLQHPLGVLSGMSAEFG